MLRTQLEASWATLPLESCVLCYVIPEERRDLMVTCLDELSTQMSQKGLPIGETSVHGLSVHESNMLYKWDDEFRETVGVDENEIVVMGGLTADTDPAPLFLVYSVDDDPDPQRQDLLRKALIDQVHAVLLCKLNALPISETLQRSVESVLIELTDDVFQYIGNRRQKQLRDLETRLYQLLNT